MGLLDDAIGEHVDLLGRGAPDPGEVERDEREALGPVRRNREAPAAPEPGEELDAGEFAYDHAAEEEWDREPDAEPVVAADDLPPLELSRGERMRSRFRRSAPAPAPAEEEYADDEPVAQEPVAPQPVAEEPSIREPAVDDEEEELFGEPARAEPEVAPAAPPSFATGPTGAETAEYDVEGALAADDPADEDVLEETPEFLQDTPDHDRLWFEQRPPKDFDFEG
jgi:hypothetical protein